MLIPVSHNHIVGEDKGAGSKKKRGWEGYKGRRGGSVGGKSPGEGGKREK